MTVDGSRIAVRRSGVRRRRRRPREAARPTAEAVWGQLGTLPAAERQSLVRAHLERLSAEEVARLVALSEAAARQAVLARLARRDDPPR